MSSEARKALRSAILNSENTKPKSKIVTFFGNDVEVRQPSVDTVLSIRSAAESDRKSVMVDMMIAYIFVPGTEEKLFEAADKDDLLGMPFGQDMTLLQKTISELTNVDLETSDAAKN